MEFPAICGKVALAFRGDVEYCSHTPGRRIPSPERFASSSRERREEGKKGRKKTPGGEKRGAEKIMTGKLHWSVLGCLIPSAVLLFLAILFAAGVRYFDPGNRPPAYVREAEERVEKKMAELEVKAASPGNVSDPDATISALFGMEQAMLHAKDFEDLTGQYILQEDSDRVSPDVQALKYRFFNLYKNLLREKDALEESKSLYETASGAVLELFSVIDPVGLSVDRNQAQKILQERLKKSSLKREQKARLLAAQDQFLEFMFDFMEISSKHYREWDKLCSARDRAYLAVFEGNWDEAAARASEASEMAPYETEAHLLLAMALLERGGELDRARAEAILQDFREKHPVHAAGFLLSGVHQLKGGNPEQALIDFDQAAAYFPKLQERVNDRLGIYRKRAFLNKSKEGRVIVNAYRAMMSGSGYFSPDFQKARIYLAAGENEKAKEKIFDHFFRRRRQGEWDKVLDDFKFSSKALDTGLFRITAGDADVRLELEEAFFFNRVILKLSNRGSEPLKNLTVLLCVRFTDMFKGDYVSFPVGETISVLNPGQSIEVGRKDISALTEDLFGVKKKFKDIIEYAAVILSDEAILWVESRTPGEFLPDSAAASEDEEGKNPDSPSSSPGSGKEKVEGSGTSAAAPDPKAASSAGNSASGLDTQALRDIASGLAEKASDFAVDMVNETLRKTADKLSAGSSAPSQNQTPAADDPKN